MVIQRKIERSLLGFDASLGRAIVLAMLLAITACGGGGGGGSDVADVPEVPEVPDIPDVPDVPDVPEPIPPLVCGQIITENTTLQEGVLPAAVRGMNLRTSYDAW